MTVEEALLAVVGAVAVALLFLGLAQALEGDPRGRRRRRRRTSARRELPPGARAPLARRPGPPPPALSKGQASPSIQETAAARSAAPVPDASEARPPDVAHGAAAEAWRDGVAALIRGHDLEEARQAIEPALERGVVDREIAGFLLDVCSTAGARDLWRLRRALRRGGGDEAALGGSLEITRLILDAPVAQALPREQRRRVSRRLWRGHTRLGLRRWRAGSFEAAVEALFQALGVRDLDEGRRRLARDLLVRTLEDMAGQSLELIPQVLGDGDRAAGFERAQQLLGHIRRTREEGVSVEDLAVASARARQLLEHIEQATVR